MPGGMLHLSGPLKLSGKSKNCALNLVGAAIIKKMEQQLKLNGEIQHTTTGDTRGGGISEVERLSERTRIMLKHYFNNANNPNGLSYLHFNRFFGENAHENTIRRGMSKLLKLDYIRLRWMNVGTNKRLKTYLITEKGVTDWIKYLESLNA